MTEVTVMKDRKFYNYRAVVLINDFLHSKVFLLLLVVLTVLCNTLSLEFPIYITVSLIAVFTSIFSYDLLPIAPMFVFMYFSPSLGNNPGLNAGSIFYPENGLYVIIGFVLTAVIAVVIRLCLVEKKEFIFAKRIFLPGLLLFCITVLLGGVGTEEYTLENLRYAALLCLSFVFVYYLFSGSVQWDRVSKDYFAWIGFLAGLTILAELTYIYVAQDIFRADGSVERALIHTGWGIHNNIGGMLVTFMPSAFYLGSTKKCGCIFTILGTLILLGAVLTLSRTSIFFGCIMYAICAVWLVIQKKNRIQNLVTYLVVLLGILTVYCIRQEYFNDLFSQFFELGISDSGRSDIYARGWEMFLDNMVFGKGFYACDGYQWGYVDAMNFIPPRWHNTVIQILASCGIVGMAAYLLHRIQTIVVFFIHPDKTKAFIWFSILTLLLISLMDCHLFNLGPGLFYSLALCFLEKEPQMKKDAARFKKRERLKADYYL